MLIDILIIIFLMGAAIALLLAEVFLLPGLTLAGAGGVLFAIGGVAFAYSTGATAGHITLAASVVAFGGAFLWLLRSKTLDRLALTANVESTVASPRIAGLQAGDTGVTLSRLAPIGKARFNNVTVEAKSVSGFIDENTPVVIMQTDGYNVIVEIINQINI